MRENTRRARGSRGIGMGNDIDVLTRRADEKITVWGGSEFARAVDGCNVLDGEAGLNRRSRTQERDDKRKSVKRGAHTLRMIPLNGSCHAGKALAELRRREIGMTGNL